VEVRYTVRDIAKMLSREARDELSRKMDDVIMSLVAVARAEDDISADLALVARLISEAKQRLEKTLQKTAQG
jgi:hypothetical protein